ncbi:carbon-nitrogen hydrolase family protein [Phenylobacterium sp.]|uniref:carbon-nitrogen hydrolase family protein n=1 Tax=Phenylobacterium sp. TaxID=1871053 RepID=UPI002FC813FC
MLEIACIQTNSGGDAEANLREIERMAGGAVEGGAQFLALPEVADFQGAGPDAYRAYAPFETDHRALGRLRALAAQLKTWMLVGSVSVRETPERLANRSYLLGADGAIVDRYDKIHLFDVTLPDGESHRESDLFVAGRRAVVADTPWGAAGLSICYDLRFPSLYRRLAQAGAKLIFIPAAFTETTGALHWHTLIRARAIETGAYVVAPAQCGKFAGDRGCYGHSLIVDPWGRVLADGGETAGVVRASLDLAEVDRFRAAIPSPMVERPFDLETVRETASV